MVLDFMVGLVTGLLSGFGIGGGTLLMIYLTGFAGVQQYTAAGINLLYFMFCAPTALVSHVKNKLIEWKSVLICAGIGGAASVVTALIASAADMSLLRRLFGGLLLYVGIGELFHKKAEIKNTNSNK